MCLAEERLHWDEVSEFLFDALSEQFHVQSETREEERIARLLTTLYADCLERGEFGGLERMMAARRQVFKARAEARRKANDELGPEEEEDDEDDWDDEDDEGDAQGGADDGVQAGLERRMERMAVAEGKEDEESKSGEGDEVNEQKAPEPTAEEEDGWTTVGGKLKGKKKGR